VVLAAVGYLAFYHPSPEPWYELGSPGTASDGGATIYVGCNNTPLVSGDGWPSGSSPVTLAWYGTTGLKPTQLQYSLNASGGFAGNAPPIEPANTSGSSWLLVYDRFFDQTGVPFAAVVLPAGQSCP
jgi:hypothetical protein